MRIGLLAAAALLLAAGPVPAQSGPQELGPRTLLPNHVLCSDLPVSAIPVPTLTVAGGHNADGRHTIVRGDTLVVNAGTSAGLAVGQHLVARRLQGSARQFPRTGEGFGGVRTAGIVTLTAVSEATSLAHVDFSCDSIEPGDYLEAYVQPELPASVQPMGEPRFDDRATVLFGADRREIFADGDVLSIDRGTAQGVARGDRFSIYRDRQDGLPLFHLGEAVVVDPAEQTSKVVVVSVKDVIQAGDVVVARRAP